MKIHPKMREKKDLGKGGMPAQLLTSWTTLKGTLENVNGNPTSKIPQFPPSP